MTAQQMSIQQALDLAVQHHQAARLTEAEAIYRKVLEAEPGNAVANHLLGIVAHQTGHHEAAIELISKALVSNPGYAEAHNNLANVLKHTGRQDEAERGYRRALELQPDYAEAHNNLGTVLETGGRREEAKRCYLCALELMPDYADAHTNLGLVLAESGHLEEAETSCRRALEINPGLATAHNNLGLVLTLARRSGEAEQCFGRALELAPDYAEAPGNLGSLLLDGDRPAEALDHFRKALELNPARAASHVALSDCLGRLVANWHVPMMNDAPRNEAYLAALQAAVTADTRILEIGTGSGLLAMMAARCGAAEVTTCETVPLIAAKAQEIIEANGLAGVITVVAKKSADLEVGVDLAHPANLLISEILSSEFLGEGVLPSIEDARRRLLAPEGRIIPAGGSIMIALFGGDDIAKSLMVGDVCGFDLGLFNAITAKKLSISRNDLGIELLSDDIEAFSFDFNESDYSAPGQKTLDIPVRSAGRCYGIIQWNRLRMDDTIVFENHPSVKAPASAWTHTVYVFAEPVDVEAGRTAVVSALHDRTSPWFALQELR